MSMTRQPTAHPLPHRMRWALVVAVLGILSLQLNLAGHEHPASEPGAAEYHCTICVGPALPQSPGQTLPSATLAPIIGAFQAGSDAPVTQQGRRTERARAPPLT